MYVYRHTHTPYAHFYAYYTLTYTRAYIHAIDMQCTYVRINFALLPPLPALHFVPTFSGIAELGLDAVRLLPGDRYSQQKCIYPCSYIQRNGG